MAMCLLFCGRDSFCSTRCLQRHATLSPWIDGSISCLNAFGSSDGDEVSFLEACLGRQAIKQMTSFQTEIVRGLSAVATCSVQNCAAERIEFTKGVRSINKCIQACNAAEETNGVFASSAAKGAACALSCILPDIA